PVGTQHTVTATLTFVFNPAPFPGVTIFFTVSGANSASGSSPTDANGQTTFTYTGTNVGTDTITAFADEAPNGKQDTFEPTDTASKIWTPTTKPPPTGGCQPSTTEPDRNGDLQSNCHTGSKSRGAGGEDKAGSKQG